MTLNNRMDEQATAVQQEYRAVTENGECKEDTRLLISEHFLDIYVNEQLALELTCTPTKLPELVTGRLYTEGIIHNIEEIETLTLCESGSRAKVFLKDGVTLEQSLQREPTCCTGNKVWLLRGKESAAQPRLPRLAWKEEWIFSLAEEFSKDSALHRQTAGTHSCYLSVEGELCFHSEDIGRHNALDKCIGYALMHGLDRSRCIVFTTGRVPTDMAAKAIAAGIPVLVTKAVPTAAAVALAKEAGLNLICRAWPDRFEIYNDERKG